MLVFKERDSNLSKNYSALFVCDNNTGNEHLLKMEDPTHSEWNPEYTTNISKYSKILRKLNSFIYGELRKLNEKVSDNTFETIDMGNLYDEDKDEKELESDGVKPEDVEHNKEKIGARLKR